MSSDRLTIYNYGVRSWLASLRQWNNGTARRTGMEDLVSKLWGVTVTKSGQPHDPAHSCSLPSRRYQMIFHAPPDSFIYQRSSKVPTRLVVVAPELLVNALSVSIRKLARALVCHTAAWGSQWMLLLLPKPLSLRIPRTWECSLLIITVIIVSVFSSVVIFWKCKINDCIRLCEN